MKRAANDATLSMLGDIYQYYIALLECFNMEEGESIQIEVKGDVSKISSSNSYQMEVKHHLKTTLINDRNIDLWNTLSNWVKEYDTIIKLDKLILYTTSGIRVNSVFYNWIGKNADEKYEALKEIGIEKKKRKNYLGMHTMSFFPIMK